MLRRVRGGGFSLYLVKSIFSKSMFIIPTLLLLGLCGFLFWQMSYGKSRMQCRVCNKKAVKDRVHNYSDSSLHINKIKVLKDGVSRFSFSKPPFQILGKEYFIYPEKKVNEMGVFRGENSIGYKGRYGHNPFYSQFYPTKWDWNNSLSNQSNLYCGKCFIEKFKNDERVLYDVLQDDKWFD